MNSVLSKLILAAGLAAIMAVIANAGSIGGAAVRLVTAAGKAIDAANAGDDETADESPLPPTSLAQAMPAQADRPAGDGRPPAGPQPFGHGFFGPPVPLPPIQPPLGPPPSPRAACEDRIAHDAARRAYLRARIAPTGAQAEAFERLDDVASNAAMRQAQFCATLPAVAGARPPELPARLEFVERELSGRLEALRATRAALAALWETLSPEQRRLFDRPPPRPF